VQTDHNIDPQLMTLRQWVAWRLEAGKSGKPTKVPYTVNGRKASTTKPTTWTDYDTAYEAVNGSDRYAGIGFVLTPPFVGIDLDNSVDIDGAISDFALEVVKSFLSYTEISVSQTGLHILVKGVWPGEWNHYGESLEVYAHSRYFAITGNLLVPGLGRINERQNALDKLHAKYAQPRVERKPALDSIRLDDREILERIAHSKSGGQVFALLNGDIAGHPSHSEADESLCFHLAFWTRGDAAQIERIWRASGLWRDKADNRPKYVERTIGRAIANVAGYRK
jgi:putative DNA primase/helicase